MSGRRRTIITEDPSPVDAAIAGAEVRVAMDLAEALDGLADFTDTGTKFKVYKVPRGGASRFEWCLDIHPPFDSAELMNYLKEAHGPGDYCIRVYVDGQNGSKGQRNFSIATDLRKAIAQPAPGDSFTEKLLLALVGGGGMKGNSEVAELIKAQQASADRSADLMKTVLIAAIPGVLALLKPRETDPAETFKTIAGLVQPKATGFGEALEMMKAVREFMPAPAAPGEDDGWVSTAVRALAPSVPDIARGLSDLAARGRGEGQGQAVTVQPYRPPPPAALAGPAGPAGRFPLLAAIREDVLFYFGRRHDPEFAAEGVREVMDKAGFGEADFAPIVAAFLASPNWVDDLAAEGLDLRGEPAWAQAFLNAIIASYSGDGDDRDGGEGRAANPGENGGAGGLGIAANASEEQGRRADAAA